MVKVETLVIPPASAQLPKTWRETFVVPYGPGREQLGTARGGEGGQLRIGPEYGVPTVDGTWWFLDVAKQRLAHYDATGKYLNAIQVPPRLLVNRRYFQWALPHALADGSLVATRMEPDGSALLRLRDGRLDEVPLSSAFWPTYDDGTLLYGVTVEGDATVVDPAKATERPAAGLLTPNGTPFSFDVDFDAGTTTIGIRGTALTLKTRTASGDVAHVGVQVRAGSDDSLHLFLTGTNDKKDAEQLVGYTQLDPGSDLGEVEPLPNPFSPADRGSPANLVVAPGSSTPMLVYVMPDGVHVYERR